MGWRAIRVCLDREEILRTQFKALLRASKYGQIKIMLPHRIGAETVDRFRGESHKSAIRNYFRRYLYIFFFIRKFPGIH